MQRPIRPDSHGPGDAPDVGTGALRDAFSLWAAGVAVVAVHTPDGMRGVTVSAFTPLSVDPPLVLLCLAADAPMLTYIREHQRFTVNALAGDQKRTAGLYADRFTPVHARFADEADAIIEGALASFVCALRHELEGGDHRILVGDVLRFTTTAATAPLVYHARAYRIID